MKALVTGGAGFIGSNLVDALLERGDEVTVVDDLSTGRRGNLARAVDAPLHELDIRDAAAVADVVGRVEPEVVFHLAAQIDVRRSVADPAFDASINVHGTINLLRAALDNGVGRFVNTSTGGAIYGENEVIPAPESHPVAPRRRTASRSSARRAMPTSSPGCTACRPSRSATATSTARARTRSARPA